MTFAKEELIKPKREWIGLTEDDRDTILRSEGSIFDFTEAKLKQKNGYAEEKNTWNQDKYSTHWWPLGAIQSLI